MAFLRISNVCVDIIVIHKSCETIYKLEKYVSLQSFEQFIFEGEIIWLSMNGINCYDCQNNFIKTIS